MSKELRDYQKRIVEKSLKSDKDIIICLPTGSGKTVIASALINAIKETVIFIVPRLELIKQASDEIGDADIIWSDKTSLTGKHCIVASKDSLRRQYLKLPDETKELIKQGVVIIDEAHISIVQSKSIIDMMKPKRVIGLTATPERMDGLALLKGDDKMHKFGIFDELLQEETIPSLIRKGYLTNLKYYAKPIEGISDIRPEKKTAEELSGSQMTKIFNDHSIWGDLIEAYEEYGLGKPALGFTTTIEMGRLVVNMFNEAGYSFRIIHGEMSVKERQELINMLKDRRIDGLVNASLLTYGFDCPQVSYAFNCRHIKSRSLWFQIVGRLLRIWEGKENAIFVDHADCISEFAEPYCSLPILDEYIRWRVDGETKEEKQSRKKKQKAVREDMKLLQKLDPRPAELVEVTTEDSHDRLIRIINQLFTNNELLIKKNNVLQEKVEKIETENINIKAENEKLRKIKIKEKEPNKDKTFEWVRTHYCKYRRETEEKHSILGWPTDNESVHKETIRRLRNDEDVLDFYFENGTFINSCNWWFNHYTREYNKQ